MSAFTHSFLTASSCCVGRCGALAVLAWMVGAIGLAPAPAAAQTPSVLLGAEDELRIRIYQWPELSGDYVIGARGNVSLPLVGPIPPPGSPRKTSQAVFRTFSRLGRG